MEQNTLAALNRLQMRQQTLQQKAQQLQARAEHLERVRRASVQRLGRRIDAHEKIVLGALVKKAGLAMQQAQAQAQAHQHQNDNDAMPKRGGLDAQSAAYDRELILGAMMWLVSVLKQPANDALTVPERQRLRDDGRHALGGHAAPSSPPASQP